MKVVEKFKIDKNNSIHIFIPKLSDKFNYYYEPTKDLHMFDEVTVILKTNGKKIVIVKDQLNEIVMSLRNSINKVLEFKRNLPSTIPGQLGKYYNIIRYNESSDQFNFSNFWLWSSNTIQTWLYNKDNKIYIEITPTYSETQDKSMYDSNIFFGEFMKSHKPITVAEIDSVTAQKWLQQCDEILNIMITV